VQQHESSGDRIRRPEESEEISDDSQVPDKPRDIKDNWRWGWDSNPRTNSAVAGFQDRRSANVSDHEPNSYNGDMKNWASSRAPILAKHPDLRKVVELWPSLPEVMRRGIVGMVKSAAQEE
jgi:hypothetical protein